MNSMTRKDKLFVNIGFAACLIACTGDFIMTYILGDYFPHYSQIRDSMSLLGSVKSPVSNLIAAWWILLCILMIIFAAGFRRSFPEKNPRIRLAPVLIIIYGLGEGLGSAVFPLNSSRNGSGLTGILHIVAGGIGTVAILILPLILMKVFTDSEHPYFDKFSIAVFIGGLVFVGLKFLKPLMDISSSPVESYQGLWQRLYVLDVYIFLVVIAFRMKKIHHANYLHAGS